MHLRSVCPELAGVSRGHRRPPAHRWWIALTYIAGAAFVAAAYGVEDAQYRRRIAELALGGFLFGLGFWMRMPTVPEVVDGGSQKWLVTEHGRWPLLGYPIMIAGLLLAAASLVRLVLMSW